MQQGPTIRNIPSHTETVCNGCEYLVTSACMRGHKTVTNNFACTHPDFKDEEQLLSKQKGRTIHFNHEGYCDTPSFCPFKNPKKNDTD